MIIAVCAGGGELPALQPQILFQKEKGETITGTTSRQAKNTISFVKVATKSKDGDRKNRIQIIRPWSTRQKRSPQLIRDAVLWNIKRGIVFTFQFDN
jgi:hypothetical protein